MTAAARRQAKRRRLVVEALLFGAIVLCLLAEAFFSGSETAIISADKALLRAGALDGDPRAMLAERLFERAETLIGTTLVGTNLAVATGTSLATVLFAVGEYVPDRWQSVATTLVMTPLILVFGEIIPKSICRASAYRITLHVVGLLYRAQQVMLPVVWFISRIADLLLSLAGGGREGTSRCFSREELVVLAELGQEQGAIEPRERQMIQSLLELGEQPVSTAMMPFVDIAAVNIAATAQTIKDLAARTGYARFPVYEGRIDNIIGIVSLVDVIFTEATQTPQETIADVPVASLMKAPVTFVPETMALGALLRDLQHTRTPMVIAVDEHGGVAGLVTREDIVEEIVGEIHDERDAGPRRLAMRGEDTFECDGKMEIDDFRERLGLDIEKEGFETVAGFVMKVAGRIPQAGDTFSHGQLRIEVLEAERRRVRRVRFVRSDKEAGSDAQDSTLGAEVT